MTHNPETIAIYLVAWLRNLGRGKCGKILCGLRGLRDLARDHATEAAHLCALDISPDDGPAGAATLSKRFSGA